MRHVNWKKGFNPNIIIAKLAEIRTLNGSEVTFRGFDFDRNIAVLRSMVEIKDLSSEIANGLIVKGFFVAAKKKDLNQKDVLKGIKKAVQDYDSQPEKPYWLVSTLNIKDNMDLPSFRLNGCEIRFHRFLPSKYQDARSEAIESVSSWLIDKDEDFSQFVVVRTLAKSEFLAAEKCLNSIDLLRGIWNLFLNPHMVLSSGQKKPINRVILGALHTVHTQKGSRVSGNYWYEPNHYNNHQKIDFKNPSTSPISYTRKLRTKLKSLKYEEDMESVIIR